MPDTSHHEQARKRTKGFLRVLVRHRVRRGECPELGKGRVRDAGGHTSHVTTCLGSCRGRAGEVCTAVRGQTSVRGNPDDGALGSERAFGPQHPFPDHLAEPSGHRCRMLGSHGE